MRGRLIVAAVVLAAGVAGFVLAREPSRTHPQVVTAVTRSPSPLASVVVGLGDSVPAGEACTCTTFVSLLAQLQAARTHGVVNAKNLAQDGLTSGGLLQQVRRDGLHADPAEVTVVTIGANDFDSQVLSSAGCRAVDQLSCYTGDLSTMAANVETLLRLLMTGRHGPVLVTGYWNVFLDGPVGQAEGPAYARDSDALTRQVNAALARASQDSGAVYVDLYKPFKSAASGEAVLLAPDGDHPSARGHVVIADALEASLVAHPSVRR